MGPSFIPKPGGAWLQCWVTAAHQWWSSEMHPASFDPIFSSSLAQGPIKGAIWLTDCETAGDFGKGRLEADFSRLGRLHFTSRGGQTRTLQRPSESRHNSARPIREGGAAIDCQNEPGPIPGDPLHAAANIITYRLLHNSVKVFLLRIFSPIYLSSTLDAQKQSTRASPEQPFFSERPS